MKNQDPDSQRVVGVGAAPTATPGREVDLAIDVMARSVLSDAVLVVEWGDYPEIGEDDWQRVLDRAGELAPRPDGFAAAYALLESRASDNPECGV